MLNKFKLSIYIYIYVWSFIEWNRGSPSWPFQRNVYIDKVLLHLTHLYEDIDIMQFISLHVYHYKYSTYPYSFHSSQTCSIFYTKRFCLKCAVDNLTGFPQEMQQVMSETGPCLLNVVYQHITLCLMSALHAGDPETSMRCWWWRTTLAH